MAIYLYGLVIFAHLAAAQTNPVVFHNVFREKHQSPPLVWDSGIATMAQNWASKCVFQHDTNRAFGENLYGKWGKSKAPINQTNVFRAATQTWYDEVKNYNYSKPDFSPTTGHFTQVVWKSTTRLGCAIAQCPGNFIFVVCKYFPAGNVLGRFTENVLPPKAQNAFVEF